MINKLLLIKYYFFSNVNGSIKSQKSQVNSRENFPVTKGAYHLAKNCENSGWRANGKIISRKFHPTILEELERLSSFPVRKGTLGSSLPFVHFSNFQSHIKMKTLSGNRTIKRHFFPFVC